MGSEAEKGLSAALDTLTVGDVPGADDGEQGELLPLPLTPAAEIAEARGAKRPGRPPGAKNRRTEDWANYILARYASPLLFMAETYSRSVHELAGELGCERDDALKIQLACADKLAPYIHSKMPIAVETDAKSAGVLLILAPGDPRAEALAQQMGVDLPFRATPKTIEQDQQVSDSDGAKSHAPQSHDAVKPLNDKEN